MEEQVIQMKGLSSFNGCSTSSSSCWDHNCLLDHKNLLIEKDRAHTVASADVSDDTDPSQLNLKGDTSNLIPSAWASLPRTSHGFFAPATPNHAEQIGASSSGGGGHTDSSSKEEEEKEEEEEEEEEIYFHRYEDEDELEEDEGEDISVDLMSCSEAAAGKAAADNNRKKYPHTEYPSCSECGRKFPSWKAVFGHMRCHPERDWRGIRPAMHKNPIKNYAIFRSPITGKRSKRPKPRPAASLPLSELNIEEHETADFLLMLSSAARTIEEKTNHRLVLPSLSSSSSSSLRVPELIETQSDSIDGNEEEDLVAHAIITTTNTHEDGKKAGEAMNKDTQRRKKATLIGNIIDEGKYECSACKKMFASHQALGGHRASHRKLKGCFAKTISNAGGEDPAEKPESESEGEDTKEELVREEVNISPPPQINKGHECRICHRVFETGQALGGHKRCHWNGERIVKQKKQKKTEGKGEREETEEEEEEEEERRRLLLLDLNLPPPLDEEDLSVLDGATQSKTMSNPNNLLPQKAKAKTKKRYYYCHLCNETFASREALCKHQNNHAGSSFMSLVLTPPHQ